MRTLIALTLMIEALVAVPLVLATDVPRAMAFDIPAQPLSTALLSFSEQARVQLILSVDTSALPPCLPLQGRMSAERAIEALLAESGLDYHFSSENTVTVRREPRPVVPGSPADALKSPPQPAN